MTLSIHPKCAAIHLILSVSSKSANKTGFVFARLHFNDGVGILKHIYCMKREKCLSRFQPMVFYRICLESFLIEININRVFLHQPAKCNLINHFWVLMVLKYLLTF